MELPETLKVLILETQTLTLSQRRPPLPTSHPFDVVSSHNVGATELPWETTRGTWRRRKMDDLQLLHVLKRCVLSCYLASGSPIGFPAHTILWKLDFLGAFRK